MLCGWLLLPVAIYTTNGIVCQAYSGVLFDNSIVNVFVECRVLQRIYFSLSVKQCKFVYDFVGRTRDKRLYACDLAYRERSRNVNVRKKVLMLLFYILPEELEISPWFHA
jgi:hypothetical protein